MLKPAGAEDFDPRIVRREHVRALYAQGLSFVEIAEQVGISRTTVGDDLKAIGVARRPKRRYRRHGPDVERICEYCERVFVARASEVAMGKGRFCSGSCVAAHGHKTGRLRGRPNEKIRVACVLDGCEEEVERSPSHVLDLVYCSREHAYADEQWSVLRYERRWPDGPNMVPCSECEKLVNRPPSETAKHPHQFCSDECQSTYVKKHGLGGFRVLIEKRAGGRARQRWFGRWRGRDAGKLGGRPHIELDPDFVDEVRHLSELGWGRVAIARRLETTQHRVRVALRSLA